MRAHHNFRDFAHCDSGMIPWLLIADLVSRSGRTLADPVEARMSAFPCSGEINFKVQNVKASIAAIEAEYAPKANTIDRTDGLSLEFDDWRFNLRGSNTEPVLRLNVESRASQAVLTKHTDALSWRLSAAAALIVLPHHHAHERKKTPLMPRPRLPEAASQSRLKPAAHSPA